RASAPAATAAVGRLPLADFPRKQLPSNVAALPTPGSAAAPAGASTAAGVLSHFVAHYHQGWRHSDWSAPYRKAAGEPGSAG
ncbi:aminopeptidase PepB, partial [Klebsiella quasipneumoniae]|nr:aminopeptidase PepB [Klebsiella quasipneumoniae]